MGKYLKMADVFVGEYKPKRRIDAWPPSKYGETLIELLVRQRNTQSTPSTPTMS